ncbi:pseudo histidine-containing phosphotransfer protein 2-like [Tripterygium wilfordii]|uniref:pseudo histidine-containing phosphotransfer protein 2-like n=1 Tax=Tripterygium wilfordii TaxID=458696 RepID=UPI0018F81E93|nr:pseudo histidine-containing phosphotransfer protein 2-like [Tripterygium wilfordii]
MDRKSSPEEIAAIRQSFFDEGIIDQAQFEMLEGLADAEEPNFVEEVMKLFINDSKKQIDSVEQLMRTPIIDSDEIDDILYQLKGSSASTGTIKIRNEVVKTRSYLEQGNIEGSKVAFEDLKIEHAIVKAKLESYFQVLKQAKSAAGDGDDTSLPPK